MSKIIVNGLQLTVENILQIAYKKETKVILEQDCQDKIKAAQELVLKAQNDKFPVYGLTRDVGQFKNESLESKRQNYDWEVLVDHSTRQRFSRSKSFFFISHLRFYLLYVVSRYLSK